MHRIEQQLGERLPLATLLQAPTIEQLAAGDDAKQKGRVHGRLWWRCSRKVRMHPSSSASRCWRQRGWDSAILLPKLSGPEQPFYALNPRDWMESENA